jgi:hypothetical protein
VYVCPVAPLIAVPFKYHWLSVAELDVRTSPFMVTVGVEGVAFTVTTPVALFVQPLLSVPVKVYVVVPVGVTDIDAVVAPVFQEYVLAPLPLITA